MSKPLSGVVMLALAGLLLWAWLSGNLNTFLSQLGTQALTGQSNVKPFASGGGGRVS